MGFRDELGGGRKFDGNFLRTPFGNRFGIDTSLTPRGPRGIPSLTGDPDLDLLISGFSSGRNTSRRGAVGGSLEGSNFNVDAMFQGEEAARDVFRGGIGDVRKNLEGLQLPDIDALRAILDAARTSGLGFMDEGLTNARTSLSDILPRLDTIFDESRVNIADLIAAAQPGNLFGQIDTPEADLSDVLAGDLAGIGAASSARQSLAQQNIAARGMQFGGLESTSVQGQLDALGFAEGSQRGLEGQTARGLIRDRESEIEQFNATLQAQLLTQEELIKLGLAQSQVGAETAFGLGAGEAGLAGLLKGADIETAGGRSKAGFERDIAGLQSGATALEGVGAQIQISQNELLAGILGDEAEFERAAENAPGLREMTELSFRFGVQDREFARAVAAGQMTQAMFDTLVASGATDEDINLLQGWFNSLVYQD